MINREATIRWKGYDPDELSSGSPRRVWANCDECGHGRWVENKNAWRLCASCAAYVRATDLPVKEIIDKYNENYTLKALTRIYKASRLRIKKLLIDNNICIRGVGTVHRGRVHTEISKQRMSAGSLHIAFDDWCGYAVKKDRDYLIPDYACIQLNTRFKGSEGHHITKSIVAYIPMELHKHIPHNIKTGENMGEMNALAIQFINGGL